MVSSKTELMTLINDFVNKRPGLSFADYGDSTYYNADKRKITQALNDFRILARQVELRESISLFDVIHAMKVAYSGRLSLVDNELEYCTGQYFPTEYRACACSIMALALWKFWRDCGYDNQGIRKQAVNHFGLRITKMYFH